MNRLRLLAHCLISLMLIIPVLAGLAPLGVARVAPIPAWPNVPPVASYRIAVSLNPGLHALSGHETITFINRTNDTIDRLVFHLYLNAFRDTSTTFMRESDGEHRGYTANPANPGWTKVDVLQLEAPGGTTDLLAATVVSETLMTTTLPQPLLPGGTLTLTLDFHAQLPQIFARTGFAGDFYLAGQWFPKLAGYREGRGWNAYQFHANSEFFADFGSYDVAITAPSNYIVGGAGLPAGEEENGDGTTTHHFHAEAVIDFAWTADPRFAEARRQVGPTEVVLLYIPTHQRYVQRYLDAVENALNDYGAWYGPYPYPRLTVVDVPDDGGGAGGMEYPTFVTVGPPPTAITALLETSFPEVVTVHEVAHQWWQSVVATNEFEEPWLDEGMAEYSGQRLMDRVYSNYAAQGVISLGKDQLETLRFEYMTMPDLAMYGRAWDFPNAARYTVAAYYKPAVVLATMERLVGEERWLIVLSTYFQRYRFRHPTTQDLLGVVAEVAGREWRDYMEPLIFSAGLVDYGVDSIDCSSDQDGWRCETVISRLGQVPLPVEVEMTFADGSKLRESWDGRAARKDYVYSGPEPLESVQLDPEHKIMVDVNPLNDSITRKVQAELSGKIASSLSRFIAQSLDRFRFLALTARLT